MSKQRIAELEREIELTKQLIDLKEKLNVLKCSPSYVPYPVYIPQIPQPIINPWYTVKTITTCGETTSKVSQAIC